MAHFDTSSCPSEFVIILRKLQSETQDQEKLVAKEKQLIQGAENQIAEKTKATKLLQERNAELEGSIQHLNVLYHNQLKHIESLRESGELLKEQAKNKDEMFEVLKEKNHNIMGDCQEKYHEFAEKFMARMSFYETLPLVPEYKAQLEKNIQLHRAVESKQKEEAEIKEKINALMKTRDSSQAKFSLNEWGVNIAKMMQKVQNLDSSKTKMLSLLKEVLSLEKKKKKIQAELDKQSDVNISPQTRKNQESPSNNAMQQSINLPKVPSFQTSSKPSAASSVPDFRSFLKGLSAARGQHVPGSSGSSLRGLTGSVPNIPSKLFDLKIKPVAMPDLTKPFHASDNAFDKRTNTTMAKIDCRSTPPMQRSISLTALLPQVKPMKKTDPSAKLSSKAVSSLADWLNPPSKKKSLGSSCQKLMQIDEKESDSEEPKNSIGRTSISERASWPFTAVQSHARVTEVPLLRQVQEKILHQKMTKDQEEEAQSKPENDSVTVMEMEEEQHETNERKNMLKMFDGPTYDVPMAEEEDCDVKKNVEPGRSVGSPSPGHSASYSVEEHQRMMAELQKSPEDYFQYHSNIMTTDDAEDGYLISPTKAARGTQQRSPENVALRCSPSRDFQFAVPTEPPPGHAKKSWSASDETFSFEHRSMEVPEDSSSPFGGFSFGGAGDATMTKSARFSFNDNGNVSEDNVKLSSDFSFSFGAGGSTSPPESSSSIFSFPAGTPTSPDEPHTSFFNAQSEDGDDSASSSFASIFGCNK